MAKIGKAKRLRSLYKKRHANLHQKSSCTLKVAKKMTHSKVASKNDWQDATCSVCMESPHNAVLLLCSSYKNGCRPYMCGTSCRFSNCLDQYKKAYTKQTSLAQPSSEVAPLSGWPHETDEVPQLSCPICRGQVKGWTVVEQARKDLNEKQRNCMQESCSFVGSYKQLRKHVKSEHPLSRPRDVDPALEEKWKSLERERERSDVISAITSSDPNAIVFGDFVIEGGSGGLNNHPFHRNFEDVGGVLDDNFFRIDPFINRRSFRNRFGFLSEGMVERLRSLYADDSSAPAREHDDDDALPGSHHHRRFLFGRINRRPSE